MILVQWMLVGLVLGLLLGLALLYRLVRTGFAEQQRALGELRHELRHRLGDVEDGELAAILRDLRVALKEADAERTERRRADERQARVSEESRWERDWKRAFESDR